MEVTTPPAVDYTQQIQQLQSSLDLANSNLDAVNANLQLQNHLSYIFIVCFFTVLVCCLLYKVIRTFI